MTCLTIVKVQQAALEVCSFQPVYAALASARLFFASDVISAAALRADGFVDLVRMCYKTMTIKI